MDFFTRKYDKNCPIYDRWILWGLLILLTSLVSLFAQQIRHDVPELKKIDVVEKAGESLPLSLSFIDENGERKQLSDYINGSKPVIITLAYYNCPMLCTLVLNAVAQGIDKLPWTPGNEFVIFTISINPEETTQLAAAKKENYLNSVDKPGAENGWHFFTGNQSAIDSITAAVGFQYYYDEEQKQYAHPAVSYVITPDGKISRYLYGLEYNERDLRLALLEASQGKIGDAFDRILLYCYHYDPDSKGYVLFAGNVMRLGGILTMVILAAVLIFFWRREHNQKSINDIVQEK